MNRPYDEQVSALLDGELPAAELKLLLRQAQRDQMLGARLSRYVLIRDALHRNLPRVVEDGLADRVANALAAEPVHEIMRRPFSTVQPRRWVQSIGGLAIAASVSMAAVVLWPVQQSVQDGGQTSVVQTADVNAGSSASGVQTVASENIRWDRLDPDVQARLNGYAITHDEQSAGRQVGIVPRHVRITGQGTDQ
ncbi:MAG: sigma-E factor negative regulatory protein [Aquisalimonadaceae bacterium]